MFWLFWIFEIRMFSSHFHNSFLIIQFVFILRCQCWGYFCCYYYYYYSTVQDVTYQIGVDFNVYIFRISNRFCARNGLLCFILPSSLLSFKFLFILFHCCVVVVFFSFIIFRFFCLFGFHLVSFYMFVGIDLTQKGWYRQTRKRAKLHI